MGTSSLPNPPLSRKVIAGFIVAGVGALLPLVGVYHVAPELQGLISTAEYGLASFLYREEETYLKLALAKVQSIKF